MRTKNLQELVGETGYVTMEEAAREAMIANHGPKAAAWLIFKHRRQLRKTGAIDFTLPRKKELPMWMALALETLRRREGWSATELPPRKGSVYRVFRVARASSPSGWSTGIMSGEA